MPTTHFGYRTVPEQEKEGLVREVFSSVAGRYDLMNDLMSAGAHRFWKDRMVEWLNPQNGQQFLDVASGTGDIAAGIKQLLAKRGQCAGRLVLCDINHDMIRAGIERAEREDDNGLTWLAADATRLPFNANSFDACTIAFGIRNVTRLETALSETHRVLKPGGRFLCLEFSRMSIPGLASFYDAYSFRLLPQLGRLVAGDDRAYRYLAESIRRFPSQKDFAKLIGAAGFAHVKFRNLSGGIAAMHSAWKL